MRTHPAPDVTRAEHRGYDAVVVGAGVIGAAVARALAQDEARVLVVERHAPAAGTSSHCEGNVLVSDKGPGPELELALDARRRWEAVARDLAEELGPGVPDLELEAKGGLVVATTPDGADALLAFAQGQRAAGVVAEELDVPSARGLEPWLTPDLTAAISYPQDAQVQPTIATEALLASARRSGAQVWSGCEVLGATTAPDGTLHGLVTSRGPVRTRIVINAAGPWAGEVGARLGAPLPVRPRRGVVLVTTRMPQRVFHKVYDADYVGAVGSGAADLQTSSVVESTPAGTVLIGSSREQVGFRDELRVDVLAELAAKAVRLFPFLAEASVLRCYSGFRPFTPDHLPLIGADPRVPGLWHATGHEGAGVGLSVATGALLADLVARRTPALDPAAFAPSRPGLAGLLAGAA